MNRFYTWVRWIVMWFIRFFYNIRVVGRENEPKKGEGPFIVCANHISAGDPIAIGVTLRYCQPHYMAKKELFNKKPLAWFFRNLGMVPVNRDGNDVSALRTVIGLLRDGKSVGIFPQGTRHKGEDPRQTEIKGGLGMIWAHTQVPVLPIYIQTKDHEAKLFRRRTLIIGKPILPEELDYHPRTPGEYERISRLIFDRICLLGEEFESAQKQKKTRPEARS